MEVCRENKCAASPLLRHWFGPTFSAVIPTENMQCPMSVFTMNMSFHSVNISDLTQNRPEELASVAASILLEARDKLIDSSDRVAILSVGQVHECFERLERQIPKMITAVSLDQEDEVPMLLPRRNQNLFNPEGTYVIAGGLGGLGRSIARWIVKAGARNLILLSRFGPRNEDHFMLLDELARKNVRCVTPAADVVDHNGLSAALISARETLPEIKGVIQSFMVLEVSRSINVQGTAANKHS
jgi:hypothetical protein